MTNPKLREMLEAASKKLLMPTLGHPSNMLSDRDGIRVLDLAASKFADAALAVFTQYLQEADVVERAFNAGREGYKAAHGPGYIIHRWALQGATTAALNSIGGE